MTREIGSTKKNGPLSWEVRRRHRQHQQDLFGGVGDRRQSIRREHRQRHPFGQAFFDCLRCAQRRTDQEPFQGV